MLTLNAQQMAAVEYIDGPLLVLAGAGSGKTRVITKKIAFLIEACEYKAKNIIALTFTNKAAKEMQERVGQTLNKTMRRGLSVSTFHNLGLSILRKEHQSIGLKPTFTIFDAQDCFQLLKTLAEQDKNQDKETLIQIQTQISAWKNNLLSPEAVLSRASSSPIEVAASVLYHRYEAHLSAYNAVDFDDLILKPVLIFKQNPAILERWQNRIRYMLIDEYQDTNASQYLFVKLLCGVRGAFTVVGDDDQSIYAWRGAQPENLGLLKKDYPRLKVVKLEQNYRSTVAILKAANQLISNNPHLFNKKLWSDIGFGELLRVVTTEDELNEAEQVASEIISHKLRSGSKFHDYAILYRGNHQSRVFEKVLRNNQVPYKISGGSSFFSRSEIKDIFAYLRLIVNAEDDNAFLRVINTPKRGIGHTTIEKLSDYASGRQVSLLKACHELGLKAQLGEKACHKLHDFATWIDGFEQRFASNPWNNVLKALLDESNYETFIYESCDSPAQAERRIKNVGDLFDWIEALKNKDQTQNFNEIINRLVLMDILDRNEDEAVDQVQLMTLHASKGLEFPHVFMVGMEEEFLPHKTSIEEENIEEERRLAYVGITRAQKSLCFTMAKRRRRYGDSVETSPSRFLDELPQDLLVWQGKANQSADKKAARAHLEAMQQLLKASTE